MSKLRRKKLMKRFIEAHKKLQEAQGQGVPEGQEEQVKFVAELATAMGGVTVALQDLEELNAELIAEQAGEQLPVELASSVKLSNLISALIGDSEITGAEREAYEELGIEAHGPEGGIMLPYQFLAVDAATSAPAKSHVISHGIIGRVFPTLVASRLGIRMEEAGVGSAAYLVLSAGANAEPKDDVAIKDAEAATLALTTLEPTRFSAAYSLRGIDMKRVPNYEESLRADLNRAIATSGR